MALWCPTLRLFRVRVFLERNQVEENVHVTWSGCTSDFQPIRAPDDYTDF